MKRFFALLFQTNRSLITSTFLAGILLTCLLLFVISVELEKEDRKIFFQEVSHIRTGIIDELQAADQSLLNIGALFTVSSAEVDSDGFRVIAEAALQQPKSIRSVSFARWVSTADKDEFEKQNWRASGVADFRIHHSQADQIKSTSYLPIVFWEPLTPKKIALIGFDLWSDKRFHDSISEAIDTGNTVVNDMPFDGEENGFTLLKAVYSGKISPSGILQRRQTLNGILRISLDSQSLMAVLARHSDFDVRLISKDDRVLAEKRAEASAPVLGASTLADSSDIKLSDSTYRIDIRKSIPFSFARLSIYFMGLLMGASLSLLASTRLADFLRKQEELREKQVEIERKVEEKTKELEQNQAVIAEQRAKMFSSAKLSALGEMAGGIAHEINTPLTTMQLLSEQILDNLKAANPNLKIASRNAEKIGKTIERIAKIVHGLHTISRDGSRDDMREFCVVQTVEDTLALCREKFQNFGVQLKFESPDSIKILGREVQISQTLLNLLNNAFDAVHGVNKPWISIRISEDSSAVEISIEDNGIGISEGVRDKLFQPFFSTKEMGKGTGLGLSISKGIIESHYGKLSLDPLKQHTSFRIELPKTVLSDHQEKGEPSLWTSLEN